MIPDIETKSLQDIKAFQEVKLKEALLYLSKHSSFYQRLFKTHQIEILEIHTLEDLSKIPTTSKEDLQQYNDDFICVPKHQIIDYSTTSGTLGRPVTFALTDNDLDRLAYNEAISFACAGMQATDVVQLMTTMDRRFMAGLAYFLGARKLGAGIIRVGTGVPELQWDSILKFKPTYLIAVPSFLIKLIEHAKTHHIDVNSLGVKGVICIGEPIRNLDFSLNTLGQSIKTDWNINLFSTYASTEMSTAFTECEAEQGGHHHPELIIVEILDEQEQQVNPGDIGELTITTLGVEAMPLLRFKTGDMLQAHHSKCSCGRTTRRLGPVVGRKQQMIKYKGTTLYPPAIINVLSSIEGIEDFVIEIRNTDLETDELEIHIVAQYPTTNFKQDLQDHLRAKLRVTPSINFVDHSHLEQLKQVSTSRKSVTVIDHRIQKI